MSEMKAICLPSGDQRAHLSWAFEELWVRLRVGPFLIGAVKTSPRATKSARSPLGDSGEVLDVIGGRDARRSHGDAVVRHANRDPCVDSAAATS